MSTQVVLAGNNIGGTVLGAFGPYQQATDGTFTVDSRDVPELLKAGMSYIQKETSYFDTSPATPLAAASGQAVASTALSNGTVAVSNQPDVMRPLNVIIGTGTSAPTAGSVAIAYVANDGSTQTDTFTTLPAASGSVTQATSKGVAHINTITIAGVTGGTSPWLRVDTTAAIAVPIGVGAQDFKETLEFHDGTVETNGTLQTSLGCIAPSTAPNGTHTFGFAYTWIQPTA